MSVERQVKLFCKGTVALMHCEEDRLIIEPLRRRGLLATLAKLPTLERVTMFVTNCAVFCELCFWVLGGWIYCRFFMRTTRPSAGR